MRLVHFAALLATLAPAAIVSAQGGARAERGVFLTLFRSPSTGVELRAGHAAAHVGFYPTVLRRDGARDDVNFVRAGATYYLRARGASPYVSPSLLWSLDPEWRGGALTEVGFRGQLYGRVNGRLGAGVLTTLDGRVRVNPTVGLDLRLGGAR
jgi:hypothetical protein